MGTRALVCKDRELAVDPTHAGEAPAELSDIVEQVFRRAGATYGDAGEMSPVRRYLDVANDRVAPPPRA